MSGTFVPPRVRATEGSADPGYHPQLPLLRAELRTLHHQADLAGCGDTIHRLRNYIGNAHTALQLIEVRLATEHYAQLELLLDLAQVNVRDARALIARAQATRAKKD